MLWVGKVREGLAKNDYKDPGWFKHPEGTVAFEYKGQKLADAPRGTSPDSGLEATEWRGQDPRQPRPRPAGHPPRKPGRGRDGKPLRAAKNPDSNH